MQQGETRKLAAIMFTDIVGFSRQMGADEARMLRLLEIHNQIIGSLIFPVEDSTSSGLPVECERSAGTLRDPERAVGRDGRG